MSKTVAKRKARAVDAEQQEPSKPAKIVGRDIDKDGRRLRPGRKLLLWTTAITGTLEPCPGFLSRKLPDGNWAIVYFQRNMASWADRTEYSDTPQLHRWTFEEAFDEWDSNRSEG